MTNFTFTPSTIDYIFPFVVFFYGAAMTFVLNNQKLMQLAEERLPHPLLKQMQGHRFLGVICLCLGFFWSLQNIWFYA